ncbi:hypothetical protein CK203_116566 [Vitis vinifera]|uniref:Uncharacterized protein n=1 Tax=Vitis vinifera TaxID=29760 RepID=A0A438FDJ8_VITVI|nr:hypothetical protein CK203_116566 [Vitis vinifera]
MEASHLFRRRVEGCVPSEGSMLCSQFDLPSWVRVEGRLVRFLEISDMNQQVVMVDQFTTAMDETPHDSLPPPPPPPVLTVLQASSYLLHGHSEVAPPAVVQTTIIDDVHTYGPYRAAYETFRMPDIERYTALLPSHSPPTLQHNVSRRELEVLRQRSDESVSSFISRRHGKIAEIIDRPSEKDQIQMVLRSLQPRIARHVVEYRSRAPHQTYDQAYMPRTLVLPYFATQGTERPHALRKLTKAKLLMALIPKSLPQPVPPQFKMDLYCQVTLGLQTPTPFKLVPEVASVQTTTVVPLTFPYYSAQTPFVLILDVEKVRTPYVDDVHIPDIQNVIRGSRVRCIDSSPEPDQSRDYHHSEGLSHMVTVGKAICIVFSDDDLPPEDNGLALNVYPLATAIALGYTPFDFGPSTQTVLRIPTSFNCYWVDLGFTELRPFLILFIRSTMVLDIMRNMSYLPGMGLGWRQHGPSEFMAIPIMIYHSDLGSSPLRASESQMPSDGIIRGLSTVQEAELQRLIHWLQLSDGAPSTSTSALAAPSSLDRISLMTLYFQDEIDEHGIFSEIRDIIGPALEVTEDVIVVADLFDGHVGPVEGASDFVNLPFSFDVLSGFISRSDDVHDFSFMDLSVFEYLLIFYDITLFVHSSPTSQILDIDDDIARHDSDDDSSSASDLDPIDQRVSPATEHTKVVDFGIADQPSELKIGSDLSTDESDCLIQLLKSYLNIFAWSYEDMPGLNPSISSIVCHFYPMPDRLSKS